MKKEITTFKKYGTSPKLLANDTPSSRSKTGVKGVYITGGDPKHGKIVYQARISVNHREVLLYAGKDLRAAIAARKKGEEIYYKPIIDEAKKDGLFNV